MTVLQNISLEQAADLVAMRVNVKSAGVWDNVTGAVGNFAKKIDLTNPLHAAGVAGVAGAGLGAAGSLMSSDKEKRKRWLQNALFGGTIGGIGGGALSAAMGENGLPALSEYDESEIKGANKPTAPTTSERVANSGIPETRDGIVNSAKKLYGQIVGDVAAGTQSPYELAAEAVSDPRVRNILGGGIAGGSLQNILQAVRNNRAGKADLLAALNDPKFKPTVTNMNASLAASGRPTIAPEQLGNLRNSLNASTPEKLLNTASSAVSGINRGVNTAGNWVKDLQAKANAIASARKPVPAVTTTPVEPAMVTPAVKPAIPVQSARLNSRARADLQNAATAHRGAASKVTKPKFGLMGIGLGGLAGAGLNMMNTPPMSLNDRNRLQGILPIQN
jgi:hypothetical protein